MKERESPAVYICSKYSGDIGTNVKKARLYCRLAVERGYVPLAPHLLLPQFVSEETEREKALAMDMTFLTLCSELWVCGEVSEGMEREISRAKELGMEMKIIREEELGCLK